MHFSCFTIPYYIPYDMQYKLRFKKILVLPCYKEEKHFDLARTVVVNQLNYTKYIVITVFWFLLFYNFNHLLINVDRTHSCTIRKSSQYLILP